MLELKSQETHGSSSRRWYKSTPERRRNRLRETLSAVEAHVCPTTAFLSFLLLTVARATAPSQGEIWASFADPQISPSESTKRHISKLFFGQIFVSFRCVYATTLFRSLAEFTEMTCAFC